METKIQKEFIDSGFGFDVRLSNVPMVKVRGEWTPKINYDDLARAILLELSHKKSRLTGNETRFVRTYFGMTLQKFAKRFCVTHVAVMKWEQAGSSPTSMSWATEKDIRLFILTGLGSSSNALAKLYMSLENVVSLKGVSMNLDMQKLAA